MGGKSVGLWGGASLAVTNGRKCGALKAKPGTGSSRGGAYLAITNGRKCGGRDYEVTHRIGCLGQAGEGLL